MVTVKTEETKGNLYQRIAALTDEIGAVDALSKNQYGKAAIGVDDIETELRPLFAKHGVVTHWSHVSQPAGLEKNTWLVHVKVTVVNADAPEDAFSDEVYDTGTNISAAVSFAIKRYYRALLHLTTRDNDDQASTGGSTGRAQGNTGTQSTQNTPAARSDAVSEHEAAQIVNLVKEVAGEGADADRIMAVFNRGKELAGVDLAKKSTDLTPAEATEVKKHLSEALAKIRAAAA